MWIFEVNDIALSVWQDRQLRFREPGIANVIDGSIVFGDEAIRQFKSRPALCHLQYWQKLNQEPTVRQSDGIATQADLIYQHLLRIKEQVGLVDHSKIRVVVPNDVTNPQLELLYGVFQYVDLDIIDFVVAAVGATRVSQPVSHHLDVGLNRAVLTELSVSEELTIGDSQPLTRSGYIGLMNAWTNEVARVSLEESRFDPRKFGSTEQLVFDRFLDHPMGSDDLHIDIEHDRGTHHVSVKAEELLRAGVEVFEPIGARLNRDSTIALSPQASHLMGLGDYLIRLGHAVRFCSEDALLDALLEMDTPSVESSDERVVHRSFRVKPGVVADSNDGPSTPVTHILSGANAVPIDQGYIAMHPNGEGEYFRLIRQNGAPVLVPSGSESIYWNDQPVDSKIQVRPGDRIRCADTEFLLITVNKDG